MPRPTRRELLRRLGLATAAAAAAPLLGACEPGRHGGQGGQAGATATTAVAAAVAARFPAGFAWGAATSAYQVEGAAREDGRGESIWDRFSHEPGRIRDGSNGDVAADHYHRWAEDLDLMRELGLGSYRFSISWPRVQPDGTGPPNQRGLDFYRRLVDGLQQRGIRPMATLFHWDLPQALQDRGGWESRDTAARFADYAALVARALGDAVPTWMTINEPKTIVQVGYIAGAHAPGKQDESAAYVALHHLLLGHGLALRALRAARAGARVGPALNLAPVYPADSSAEARGAAHFTDGLENRLYLDPVLRGAYPADMLRWIAGRSPMRAKIRDGDLAVISSPVDLVGVQYYNPLYVDRQGQRVFEHPRSQAGWQEIYPQGMEDVLLRLGRDYGDVPLVVTENGMPSTVAPGAAGRIDDADRIAFLRDHLLAAHRAIRKGVRLEGYHLWSLLDNFEWAEGYTQRWGVVYVDYRSQRRTPKQSALWYRDVIRAGGL